MTQLNQKHVLITGGGSGIGLAIARAFHASGAKLTIAGRSKSKLEEAAIHISGDILALPLDVTDQKTVQEQLDSAAQRQGAIDILINNAGQALAKPFSKTSEAEWKNIFDVNVTGIFHCTQAVLPAMKDNNWGRIINIASTASLKGYAYTTAYCAAKHAVLGFTRSLALELAKTQISVNAVCPGFTHTQIADDAIQNIMEKTGRTKEQAIQELVQFNPQKRMIDPEEVADLVLWLATASPSITGQALSVSGGET